MKLLILFLVSSIILSSFLLYNPVSPTKLGDSQPQLGVSQPQLGVSQPKLGVSQPPKIGPCGLGCITWLAKNGVCSKDDVDNINKGVQITPTCMLGMAECANAYCCGPFCSKLSCPGTTPDSSSSIDSVNGIYNLSYYFPI